MKTGFRLSLILSFLFGGALIAIRLQSPTPGPEREIVAELLPGGPELAAAADPQVLSARAHRPRIISATEQLFVGPMEPPEDPDEIMQWARDNPEQALAWMTGASVGAQRDTVAEIVCPQVAQFDPARAVTLAESFASASSILHENMVQQWAEQDATAAYAYATNKPAGDPRDRLLNRVAFVLSKENPAGAAKMVAEEIFPGGLQDEAAISVLHQWALRDANAAAAWAQLFPDGALRDRAIREVQNVSADRAAANTL